MHWFFGKFETSISHSRINWPLKEENKALAKKVNTLEELDQQKEHRIVMFESKNNKLFKYIKSLDKTLKEAQQNITELKASNKELQKIKVSLFFNFLWSIKGHFFLKVWCIFLIPQNMCWKLFWYCVQSQLTLTTLQCPRAEKFKIQSLG